MTLCFRPEDDEKLARGWPNLIAAIDGLTQDKAPGKSAMKWYMASDPIYFTEWPREVLHRILRVFAVDAFKPHRVGDTMKALDTKGPPDAEELLDAIGKMFETGMVNYAFHKRTLVYGTELIAGTDATLLAIANAFASSKWKTPAETFNESCRDTLIECAAFLFMRASPEGRESGAREDRSTRCEAHEGVRVVRADDRSHAQWRRGGEANDHDALRARSRRARLRCVARKRWRRSRLGARDGGESETHGADERAHRAHRRTECACESLEAKMALGEDAFDRAGFWDDSRSGNRELHAFARRKIFRERRAARMVSRARELRETDFARNEKRFGEGRVEAALMRALACLVLLGCSAQDVAPADAAVTDTDAADGGDASASCDATGAWSGPIDNVAFPSGSGAVAFTLSQNGTAITGTLVFGKGPAPPAPTDPNAKYPPDLAVSALSQPLPNDYVEGFVFTIANGTFDGSRLQFGVVAEDVFAAYCALQPQTWAEGTDGGAPYACLPPWGFFCNGQNRNVHVDEPE